MFANEIELDSINILRTNDLIELTSIHRQLFKNVYNWAGETRSVDIKKDDDDSEYFLLHGLIGQASTYVFGELTSEIFLKGLSRKDFAKRLAYYYDQLNYIHPFREGNGRTQRIFWSRVAKDAGYEIDWSLIEGDENDEACKLAAQQSDRSALESMFDRIIKPRAN